MTLNSTFGIKETDNFNTFASIHAKVTQKKVDNPVHKIDPDTSPTINLHFGFHGE